MTSEPAAETLASETFQLAYGGTDVARGSMSVRELAPALSALDDLIERSNELLNGENSRVELRVLADFEYESFDVNFLLHQVLVDPAAAMLPTLGMLNAKQLLDVVVGTYDKAKGFVSGVAKIYKILHGQKPKEIRNGDIKDTRIIVIGDNNTIVTDVNSAKLYNDDRVRNVLTRTAQPLTRSGYDSMKLKRNNEIIETLQTGDVGTLYLPDVNSGEFTGDGGAPRELWVKVVKPNFEGGRWCFHDGSNKFGADLEDTDFQAKVNRRDQGFYKGDTFLVRLRSIQHHDKNGNLNTRNIVEKVLDQREGPRQQKLLP